MKTVFEKTSSFNNNPLSFCPGCGHGIAQRLIGECLVELGVKDQTVGVLGVGCSSPSWKAMTWDMLSVPHGRPGAAATGLKRVKPHKIVFTYQGDGDIGSIGYAETMYAAMRGENITVFCVNNTVYAMTGGQMSPMSLEGQKTVTSLKGRDIKKTGSPLHLAEQIGNLPDSTFSARVSLHDTANINKTKQTIKKALQNQIDGKGYSFVEIMSPCPSVWKMQPTDCMDHIKEVILQEYPLGVFKDEAGV